MDINTLKFDEKGLIPAVVQDFYTKKVLTVAYMSPESLKITIDEQKTCFYSRSRKKLWRKGETSGNFQHVVSVTADCDGDAIVIEVIKDGPACHTGEDSCFFNLIYRDEAVREFTLRLLYELMCERNKLRPEKSYTTYLFEKGTEKILKKVGEESSEVIISAMKGAKDETIFEIADLCYHVMVLMVDMGITPDEITRELSSRHIIDRKAKQETMK